MGGVCTPCVSGMFAIVVLSVQGGLQFCQAFVNWPKYVDEERVNAYCRSPASTETDEVRRRLDELSEYSRKIA